MSDSAAMAWYVVQTHHRDEAKAAFHLARQGFEAYYPRYRKLRRHARRTEEILAPLFPAYLFVKIDVTRQQWRAINSTLGVYRLICNGERPAMVPEKVVDHIRKRECEPGIVHLAGTSKFRRGENVRIRHGHFEACTGLVEASSDRERVTILLDMLGRKVRVLLEETSLEAA